MRRDTFPQRWQRGMALPLALFVLVVLGAMGAYVTYFVGVQSNTHVLDLRGAQALQAAQAGLDVGAYQVMRANSCTSTTLAAGAMGGTLAPFAVQIDCVATSHADDGLGQPVTVYQITSTARAGTLGSDGVERRLQGVLSK